MYEYVTVLEVQMRLHDPGPGEGDLGMMLEHPFNSGVSHHKSAYNVIVNTFVYIPLCSNRVAIVQT